MTRERKSATPDWRICAALGHLKVLDMRDTETTDAGLAQLLDLANLESLRLDSCAIVGRGIEQLKSAPHLHLLDLSNIPATDSLLEHVTALANLQVLLIDNMYMNDTSTNRFAAFARMPNLREVHDPFNVCRIVHGKVPNVKILDRDSPAPDPFQLFPKQGKLAVRMFVGDSDGCVERDNRKTAPVAGLVRPSSFGDHCNGDRARSNWLEEPLPSHELFARPRRVGLLELLRMALVVR